MQGKFSYWLFSSEKSSLLFLVQNEVRQQCTTSYRKECETVYGEVCQDVTQRVCEKVGLVFLDYCFFKCIFPRSATPSSAAT